MVSKCFAINNTLANTSKKTAIGKVIDSKFQPQSSTSSTNFSGRYYRDIILPQEELYLQAERDGRGLEWTQEENYQTYLLLEEIFNVCVWLKYPDFYSKEVGKKNGKYYAYKF